MTQQRSPEAFQRMLYRCKSDPSHEEWIWNSRDGVTPFCVDCRNCGAIAEHVEWKRDQYLPAYRPAHGERVFRDGLPAEARAIMRQRLEAAQGTEYETPEAEWEEFIERAIGDFTPGWPMLVVVGTDQF